VRAAPGEFVCLTPHCGRWRHLRQRLLCVERGRPRPNAHDACEILPGKRAITAGTDLRLCRFFGLSDGWWLRLPADYDTELAKASLAKTLAKIRPWREAAGQTLDAH